MINNWLSFANLQSKIVWKHHSFMVMLSVGKREADTAVSTQSICTSGWWCTKGSVSSVRWRVRQTPTIVYLHLYTYLFHNDFFFTLQNNWKYLLEIHEKGRWINFCKVSLYKIVPFEWINVYVYSLISHWVQQTSQFTSLVLELSLVWSHLPGGRIQWIFCS